MHIEQQIVEQFWQEGEIQDNRCWLWRGGEMAISWKSGTASVVLPSVVFAYWACFGECDLDRYHRLCRGHGVSIPTTSFVSRPPGGRCRSTGMIARALVVPPYFADKFWCAQTSVPMSLGPAQGVSHPPIAKTSPHLW